MSTQQNKKIVRRIYDELWNERRLEVAEQVIAPGRSVPGPPISDERSTRAWHRGPREEVM